MRRVPPPQGNLLSKRFADSKKRQNKAQIFPLSSPREKERANTRHTQSSLCASRFYSPPTRRIKSIGNQFYWMLVKLCTGHKFRCCDASEWLPKTARPRRGCSRPLIFVWNSVLRLKCASEWKSESHNLFNNCELSETFSSARAPPPLWQAVACRQIMFTLTNLIWIYSHLIGACAAWRLVLSSECELNWNRSRYCLKAANGGGKLLISEGVLALAHPKRCTPLPSANKHLWEVEITLKVAIQTVRIKLNLAKNTEWF